MSSHHFVREGQEPALLIVDPPLLEDVQPLLEWAPFVMVMADAVTDVLWWGIKIDAVLGTHEKVSRFLDVLGDQQPLQLVVLQGEDILIEAFQFAVDNDQTALNIVAAASPYYFSVMERFPQLDTSLLSEGVKWTLSNRKFEKWMPANAEILIRQNTSQALEIAGLAARGEVFSVIADGMISVQSDCPFWVGERIS